MSSVATNETHDSLSTAPTSQGQSSRPSLPASSRRRNSAKPDYDYTYLDPRSSTETYAFTEPDRHEEEDDDLDYAVPELPQADFGAEPVWCTPLEFAELFPSHRRLLIRHDDTTEDGNLNLRLDTEAMDRHGRMRAFTLFHLRMYDLRQRDFSLRRYCRDSGREVCHSGRKEGSSAVVRPGRPSLPRSMSSVLASLRGKPGVKPSSSTLTASPRADVDGDVDDDDDDADVSTSSRSEQNYRRRPTPTSHLSKTIRLQFSNYAQVSIKRRGRHQSKRYEYEYWGRSYIWRRRTKHDGLAREVSFHLVDEFGAVLAHIVPIPLTSDQAQEHAAKGGWVPPCSMWIRNLDGPDRTSDVAEYVLSIISIATDHAIDRPCFANLASSSLPVLLSWWMTASSGPSTTIVDHLPPNRSRRRRPLLVLRNLWKLSYTGNSPVHIDSRCLCVLSQPGHESNFVFFFIFFSPGSFILSSVFEGDHCIRTSTWVLVYSYWYCTLSGI